MTHDSWALINYERNYDFHFRTRDNFRIAKIAQWLDSNLISRLMGILEILNNF